jgi:hypothetical protein
MFFCNAQRRRIFQIMPLPRHSRVETHHISCGRKNASRFPMEERDPLTERIIGCVIEVHRELAIRAGLHCSDADVPPNYGAPPRANSEFQQGRVESRGSSD